jgi:hypothetical protein
MAELLPLLLGAASGIRPSLELDMRVQTCALCSPLSTWLLLWLRLFTGFPAMTDDQPGTGYYMTYVARYCLVPHPMAVLGRKRM